jgi:hypothetical protein
MATSPNFGFPEPDNTSLVKDGAQDMRALGDAIDAFLNRPFTRNGIINGAFDIWQRGTSIANNATYTLYCADRFQINRGGLETGVTVSRQATNDTTNLPFIRYAARVQRNSGNTTTGQVSFLTSLETSDSIRFAGRTITLSFYARKGANYSQSSSQLNAVVSTGTGTDQSLGGGFTGQATVLNQTATLTTTWQRFEFTASVSSTATEIGAWFYYVPVGTAGANDWYEITGIQLEVGNQASPFVPAGGGSAQAELAMCQRYYYLHASGASALIGSGSYNTATNANGAVIFPVQMRIAPTLVATTGTNYYQVTGGGVDDGCNSLTIFIPSVQACQLYNNSEVSGTIGYGVIMRTLNAAASVAFNAEL